MVHKNSPPLLNTQIIGDADKPTIVLLHGLMGSWRTWYAVIEALQGRYRIVAVDLLGFGNSPKPRSSSYKLKDHVAALKATLQNYDAASPHMVVGFSLGSVLANYLVRERGIKTSRLLLISPPIYANKGEMGRRIKRSPTPAIFRNGPVAELAHHVRRRSAYITRMVARMTHPNVPAIIVDDLRQVPYYAYIRTRKRVLEKETVINRLPRIKYLSVLVGSHDMYADISHLANLAKLAGGTIRVLDGIGHSVPFTSPQAVVEVIDTLSTQDKKIKTKIDRDL